jgi:hypothetical protein
MIDFFLQRNFVSLLIEVETLNASLEDKVSNHTEEITLLLGELSSKNPELEKKKPGTRRSHRSRRP